MKKGKAPVAPETVTLPVMAERLKAMRSSKSMTQSEVSHAAGKNTATYTYWESGTTEPGSLALSRACSYMGCTPNDILMVDSPLGIVEGLDPKAAARMTSVLRKLAALHRSGKFSTMVELVDHMLDQAVAIHDIKV